MFKGEYDENFNSWTLNTQSGRTCHIADTKSIGPEEMSVNLSEVNDQLMMIEVRRSAVALQESCLICKDHP